MAMVCPNCGKPAMDQDQFCGWCGALIRTADVSQRPPQFSPPQPPMQNGQLPCTQQKPPQFNPQTPQQAEDPDSPQQNALRQPPQPDGQQLVRKSEEQPSSRRRRQPSPQQDVQESVPQENGQQPLPAQDIIWQPLPNQNLPQLPIPSQPVYDPSAPAEKQKRRKKPLLIVGIIAAVILTVLLILLLTGQDNGDKDSGTGKSAQRKKTVIDYESFKVAGNIVTMGRYEQDNNPDNGPEPIEWIVLEVWDDRALVMSRYALDAKPYNEELTDTTWEQCTLRTWLNQDFLNAAFDETEKAAILTTNVYNSTSWRGINTSGGNSTEDQIFLPVVSESSVSSESNDHTAGNEARMCAPTEYAIANGAWTSKTCQVDGRPTVCWWLRTTGYYQNSATFVDEDGSLSFYDVSLANYAVRPAFWINLESESAGKNTKTRYH